MSYADESFSPRAREPEKSSSTCLILGLIFGGVGAFVLLCGGCCVGVVFFGLDQIGGEIEQDLADNPVIQEHIGDIQTFEMNKWESIQHADEDVYVFRVSGPKGSGTVEAECLDNDAGIYEVWSGELRMDSGEVYDLFPDGDRWETEGFSSDDFDMGDDIFDFGSEDFARQVQTAVEKNPVFIEHIGDVTGFTYDLDMSMEEAGADTYVFHVTGTGGSATLRAECITVDSDTEKVESGELVMDSGERYQLYPDNPLP